MRWNWQQADWPSFSYDQAALEPLETRFLRASGEFLGVFRYLGPDDRDMLRIELIGEEAVKTSEIEGEALDRDGVQSSLRLQFGLEADAGRIPPAERGIAEMMVDLYLTFAGPLSHEKLFDWHGMIMAGRRGVQRIGDYRRHVEPMQVVSGSAAAPKVHFEAPSSTRMRVEMDAFLKWFNDSAPNGRRPLPALTRSGIAHLYFESIHPFEDGNGRIGRALSEKVLAQSLGQPSLIALADTIQKSRRGYYEMLERSNKENEITAWLIYFAETVLEAQSNTLGRVEFHIAKAKFHDRLRGRLNPRQEKAIARMFGEGTGGFKGGLSAENYIGITKASRATATRDLQDLVEKRALLRTGELKHTRYHLNLTEE